MRKIKKRYYVLFAIALLLFLALFFASTIGKNYLVKNGEKLIGRKVALGDMHINYLKVSIELDQFVLFEANKTDTFVSFKQFYIDFDPTKLFSKELSFSEIKLINPYVYVAQKDSNFNFDDITAFFAKGATKTPAPKKADTAKSEMRYSIAQFELAGGRVVYQDKKINSTIALKNLDLKLPYIAWDSKNANMGINFNLGTGAISINSKIHPLSKNYWLDIKTQHLSLEPFAVYMKGVMNLGSFKGLLNTDLLIAGNYGNVNNIVVSGSVSVDNISIKDKKGKELIRSKRFSTVLDSLDLGHNNFKIHKVEITEPYLFAEMGKKSINLEDFFSPVLKVDSSANKKAPQPKDSSKLYYSVDSVIIKNGSLDFTDLTLNRPFYYNISKLNLTVAHISESADKVPITYSVLMQKTGKLQGKSEISMIDSKKISTNLSVKDLDLVSFAPFTEYYVARPITQGTLNYDCDLKMSAKKLDNFNKISIQELDFGKKVKNTTALKVPVMLGLYILKNKNGNINFDLPVTGDPSNPEFKYRKIIWQTLGNFLVKTATEPFKALGSLFGTNPESYKTIDFEMGQDSLNSKQTDKLDKIAEIKSKKKELNFSFTQETNIEKEKQSLAILELKRNFAQQKYGLTDENQIRAKASSTADKDTAFVKYLNSKLPNASTQALESSAASIIGNARIDQLFNALLVKRNSLIRNYLISKGYGAESLKVGTGDLLNMAKQESVLFRIVVTGD